MKYFALQVTSNWETQVQPQPWKHWVDRKPVSTAVTSSEFFFFFLSYCILVKLWIWRRILLPSLSVVMKAVLCKEYWRNLIKFTVNPQTEPQSLTSLTESLQNKNRREKNRDPRNDQSLLSDSKSFVWNSLTEELEVSDQTQKQTIIKA